MFCPCLCTASSPSVTNSTPKGNWLTSKAGFLGQYLQAFRKIALALYRVQVSQALPRVLMLQVRTRGDLRWLSVIISLTQIYLPSTEYTAIDVLLSTSESVYPVRWLNSIVRLVTGLCTDKRGIYIGDGSISIRLSISPVSKCS